MTVRAVARPEILALKAYVAGAQVDDTIRLNANELPVPHLGSPALAGLNRYPEVRPRSLTTRLADVLGVPVDRLIVTRGTSEAIDTLIRSCCRAYRDAIITLSPTFEMYRVYADVQGAEVIEVPFDDEEFALDPDRLLSRCPDHAKLIFLCSPNNPTGNSIDREVVLRIARAREGRSIVVLDEAYIEFSDRDSLVAQAAELDNLVVLRTLSKAHALAGARCGAAVGNPELIEMMSRVLPPYSFSAPVTDCVLRALEHDGLAASNDAVERIVAERQRLARHLQDIPGILKVWPSDANFMLVRFDDVASVIERLRRARILIRHFPAQTSIIDCARITVGTAPENDALLSALSGRDTATGIA